MDALGELGALRMPEWHIDLKWFFKGQLVLRYGWKHLPIVYSWGKV